METRSDIALLMEKEAQGILEDHLEDDPQRFALQFTHEKYPTKLLASQLKNWQKAGKKLPKWFEKRCIFSTHALEQCSSEISAEAKSLFSGKRLLDLTGGLGVDSYGFSKYFEQVIALEQSEILHALLEYNLKRLGAENVTALNISAENFIEPQGDEKFDLIYVDPSRRDEEGNRSFLFENCSPNMLELIPKLFKISNQILIKASPLFDLTAGKKTFTNLRRIILVSINNELKETLFLLENNYSEEVEITTRFFRKGKLHTFIPAKELPHEVTSFDESETYRYLYEADTSVYLANKVQQYFSQTYPELSGEMSHPLGYFFSNENLNNFPGHRFEILERTKFNKSEILGLLNKRNIKKLAYTKKNFESGIKALRKQLGIPEGGNHFLIFTTINSGKFAFLCKRLD